MLALSSPPDDAQKPLDVRALDIEALQRYPYKIKVSFLPAWHGIEFKATLSDHDGLLYSSRGPTAYWALSELMKSPGLSGVFRVSQRAHEQELQATTNFEKSANNKNEN